MSKPSGFVAGRTRIMGNHSVCVSCGAMVDNEFIAEHIEFHEVDK